MDITTHSAKHTDVPVIRELLTKLYLELGEEASSITFLNDQLIAAAIDSGNTSIYLAQLGNNIVGLATLTQCSALYAGGSYGIIDEMFVDPEFRSMKIGSKLLEKIIEVAKEKKWHRIDVTAPTDEKWKRTIAFYNQSGFVFTGPKLKLEL